MKKLFTLILNLCLIAGIFLSSALADLQVHFIDVGQGDAAVVLCDGESLMIDGGESSKSQLIYSYLQNTLGLSHLNYIVASHPHSDHVGGLAAALNACTADVLYSPVPAGDSRIPDSKAWTSLLKYAADIYRVPQTGDSFSVGSATATFLRVDCSDDNVNNWSLILKIVYGNTSFLFTGDAEQEEEAALLASGTDLQSTVLKVGHHGSNSSSTKKFLKAVAPLYAVISVGANNEYGHPAEKVLKRLSSVGTTVFRTDQLGSIVCEDDGETITFNVAGTAPAGTSFQASVDWLKWFRILYPVLISLIGFLVSLILYKRNRRPSSAPFSIAQIIIAVLGGTPGILLEILLFEKAIPEDREDRVLTSRTLLACIGVLQILALLFFTGIHRPHLTLAFWTLFTKHRILAGYYLLMSVLALILYCTNLVTRIIYGQRSQTVLLLLLAFFGGSPGAFLSVNILRHRTRRACFRWTVPVMLITQVAVWLFLANQTWM